ncbi:MAG: aminotransferase class I/II-fold pyridoxal phosphate-dependent enzyme [Polyangiales bacterium]
MLSAFAVSTCASNVASKPIHIGAHFVQNAALAALEQGESSVITMRDAYRDRRKRLLDGLRSIGFEIAHDPGGAFYVLADARRFGQDSVSLAFDILERAHVATGPGLDFGEIAEGFLRFSFASSANNIDEAIRRIGSALR